MVLNFTITRFSIRNTLLLADEGQTSYRVDTPWSWGTRLTKITKITENSEIIGEIEWNWPKTSKVTFGGKQLERKDFLRQPAGPAPSEGTVTAPDGKEYIWKGLWSSLKLVSKEDENVTLAHYVGRSVLGDKKAVLVVEDAGAHILEFIIVSFIFVEKIRRERVEKAAGAYQGS